MRIALVLRAQAGGGKETEFKAAHVGRLRDLLAVYAPGVPVVTLSDVDVPTARIPLEYSWPGWWSKLELCRPDVRGDLLYMDLDTVPFAPLEELLRPAGFTLLRDFNKPHLSQSGLMFLTEEIRAQIWFHWMADPWHAMNQFPGDGQFLHYYFHRQANHWQDEFPGQVVSYKRHVLRKGGVPAGARVVCFHGKPRPWEIELWPRLKPKQKSA